ncbi:hypothetical protein N9B20_01945 [Mariniblastus sp.]|nr:hypothetical protein [Mariniblastus sp.]
MAMSSAGAAVNSLLLTYRGNDSGNAIVNLADVAGTRQNQTGFGSTDINNQFDFNRDSKVNLIDIAIARQNQSGFSPVNLITPSASSGFMGFGSGAQSSLASITNFIPDLGETVGLQRMMDYDSQPKLFDSKQAELSLALRDSFIEGFTTIELIDENQTITPTNRNETITSPIEHYLFATDREFGLQDDRFQQVIGE